MIGDVVYWLAIIAVILAALNLVATFFVNDDKNDDNRQEDGRDTEQ